MDAHKSENKYDIYAVIGHAVSCLLESGKPVEKDNIVMQLRKSEEQSVDGMKKLYGDAALIVANGWPVKSQSQ
ncbi:hypothetical protein ORN12_19380 [Pantoea vagans]|uniref:hypothetical protein n=1 Tax=Pantoea vagans TaxID=470934 RepID=UPI00224CE771|nr:hypothetical protein [Pantoea vagans]MCX3311123.1 hypothetical protein [Pantoea vagans]